MKGFVFIGRGGQGVKSAAAILAKSAASQGLFIQAFPEYGPERMGAPVKSYVKLSNKKIRSFSPIINPDYIVLIDNSLIKIAKNLLKPKSILLVNDVCEGKKYNSRFNIKNKVYSIDATRISLEELKMNKPNTCMLGALASFEKTIDINTLTESIKDFFTSKGKEKAGVLNAKAVKRAHAEVKE